MLDFTVFEKTEVLEVNCKSGSLGTSGISLSGLARQLTANPDWKCRIEAGPEGTMIAHVTKPVLYVHAPLPLLELLPA